MTIYSLPIYSLLKMSWKILLKNSASKACGGGVPGNILKDTHKEKASSNKTQALTKSLSVGIWLVGTSNQLFIRGSYTEINFQKNILVTVKTPLFVIGPFSTPHSISLNIGLWQISFVWKHCVFNCRTFK